jgi:hypothetical protein
MSNPSRHCRDMAGAYTHCRSRGGAGLAFVVQTWHPRALGRAAGGLGWEGIPCSVAVELDTWGGDGGGEWVREPHDNHVSLRVAARSGNGTGACDAPSAPAVPVSLGHARFAGVPDLAAATLAVRVVYDPEFNPALAAHPAFVGGVHAGPSNRDTGAPPPGTLSVFVGNLTAPVLVAPLSLDAALDLRGSRGRAWVGFTAATGADVWQAHDVLAWALVSGRRGDWRRRAVWEARGGE